MPGSWQKASEQPLVLAKVVNAFVSLIAIERVVSLVQHCSKNLFSNCFLMPWDPEARNSLENNLL